VLAYAVIAIVENPVFLQGPPPFVAPRYLSSGVLSSAALIVLVSSSLWRKQIGLHYDAWRVAHVVLAVAAVAFAIGHVASG
jgi:predicted ferric reductase